MARGSRTQAVEPTIQPEAQAVIEDAAAAVAMPEERKYTSLAQQGVLSFASGVKLTIDRHRGEYRLSFDKDKLDQAGKDFFDEKIKPMLTEHHQLTGTNHEVRFHWQPAEKDWSIRYRFIERGGDGKEVTQDGKKQYLNLHHQVQVIANGVADAAGRMLNGRLGITPRNQEVQM